VGDTVVWTQRDDIAHTTTSGSSPNPDALWDSRELQQGETFSFTFANSGTYQYFCTIHPPMTATVTVTEEGSDAATAPPEPTPGSTGDDGMGCGDDSYDY
jgi:hypothetical protein